MLWNVHISCLCREETQIPNSLVVRNFRYRQLCQTITSHYRTGPDLRTALFAVKGYRWLCPRVQNNRCMGVSDYSHTPHLVQRLIMRGTRPLTPLHLHVITFNETYTSCIAAVQWSYYQSSFRLGRSHTQVSARWLDYLHFSRSCFSSLGKFWPLRGN
jgi:hypothetical protein